MDAGIAQRVGPVGVWLNMCASGGTLACLAPPCAQFGVIGMIPAEIGTVIPAASTLS